MGRGREGRARPKGKEREIIYGAIAGECLCLSLTFLSLWYVISFISAMKQQQPHSFSYKTNLPVPLRINSFSFSIAIFVSVCVRLVLYSQSQSHQPLVTQFTRTFSICVFQNRPPLASQSNSLSNNHITPRSLYHRTNTPKFNKRCYLNLTKKRTAGFPVQDQQHTLRHRQLSRNSARTLL